MVAVGTEVEAVRNGCVYVWVGVRRRSDCVCSRRKYVEVGVLAAQVKMFPWV